ncbi:hypothetical protein PV08_10095 [Exophiala spinifera]|uniref:Mediator of RNA polymerase II transcription subunit 22 n=1 Tax=Exophiala spinifera TaxID=91928 RepID=A0A0D1Y7A5_9EURO|nr:uncharacterized protein PV08_10095 [Exophiala spinifera]KIW10796.1 hypothetical protein PV08_10095 [Exophiala spinifera]
MDSTVKRDTSSEAVPSAKFLQARITALSTTLIKRLENIFAVALDETGPQSMFPAGGSDVPPPPSLTDTSVQQFQLDVESTAVIRAAEEIMMLTRTLKEIWLFGGLDTLEQDHHNEEDEAMRKKMDEDIKVVEDGFKRFLERYETAIEVDTTKKTVAA